MGLFCSLPTRPQPIGKAITDDTKASIGNTKANDLANGNPGDIRVIIIPAAKIFTGRGNKADIMDRTTKTAITRSLPSCMRRRRRRLG